MNYDEGYEEGYEEEESQGGGIGGLLLILLILYLIFGKNIGKYEGMSAKEWYNEYDYAMGLFEESETELANTEEKLDDYSDCIEKSTRNYYYDDLSEVVDSIKRCKRRHL